MAQFMCLIYQAEEAWAAGGPDVDAARAGYWAFNEAQGGVIAAGEGLEPTSTATSLRRDGGGHVIVTDGPFVEAKEIIGGFMIVAAESYDRAVEVVSECPGVMMPGSSVEIREIAGP